MDWPFKYKHRSCRFVMPADLAASEALEERRREMTKREFEAVRIGLGISRENAKRLLPPEAQKWMDL